MFLTFLLGAYITEQTWQRCDHPEQQQLSRGGAVRSEESVQKNSISLCSNLGLHHIYIYTYAYMNIHVCVCMCMSVHIYVYKLGNVTPHNKW